MTDLQTEDIRGVEILRTGRWHGTNCPPKGCEFTVLDLDELVKTANETVGKLDAPVKLGHNKDQKLLQEDGYPAAGWIRNLHRVGERLVADFVKVPQKIADLMKAGALAKRSVEIMRDFDVDGVKHKLALTGVALLGADLPAVDSLKDIEKLYQGMGYAPEGGGYYFEASDEDQKEDPPSNDPTATVADLKKRLRAILAEAQTLIKGRKGTPVLRALFRDVEETLDRIAAGRSKFSKGDDDMAFSESLLKLLGLDAEADEETIAKAIVDLKSAKTGDGESAAMKEITASLEATQKDLIVLQGVQAKGEAVSLVDTAISEGRVFPAQRDTLIEMAVSNFDQTKKLVDGMPKVVDTSEHGSDANLEGDALLTSVEPTKEEIAFMVSMGSDTPKQRIALIRQTAAEKGVELPAGWESKYLPENKD